MEQLIGREEEKLLLQRALDSNEAELVAIYGRRRIGKTFLIRSFFEKHIIFEFSGIHNATLNDQLANFGQALTRSMKSLPVETPVNWSQAFNMLEKYIGPLIKKQKRVLFFDEFPWIQTPRSGFMQAFEYFWNMWASRQKNLVVVICGSAASWMIQKVINNRGGLHNRVTKRIRLLPFNLSETAAYLKSRKITLDQYQLLQLYMAMGGIPLYLKEVNKGESAAQVLDRTCFKKSGLLHDEFKILYHSLFEKATYHIEVVRALAAKSGGLTRNEIIEACSLTSGGGTTQLLDELSESGFITPYVPFDKTVRDSIYKLTDEYSLFYIKFIENSKSQGPGTWLRLSESTSWKSWSGLAFESICLKHAQQIKKEIGIADVYTEVSPWRYSSKKKEQGAQIDLLFDRKDNCINLCEIKFTLSEFIIDKNYAAVLKQKEAVFRERTQTRKTLFITLITTFGAKKNDNYINLIQKEITMEALFKN
ncbi:ATP-binding protein [[Flexibacter] sp. ATCC 35208]|uniref:AAA family ATPase n=1 Tax=[Flexibacter] sp. ATCC 35208 TaxID=1936242 RepID=UPI0009C9DD7B|nr:ATP-binding protein [[Flexibacter] sp. ATCC 35208]OMP74677.1 ATPase [[Flexibacter] sp. ATCC 35208]